MTRKKEFPASISVECPPLMKEKVREIIRRGYHPTMCSFVREAISIHLESYGVEV